MVKLRKEEIFSAGDYYIGETILSQDTETFCHTHDFYEIFIVKEGEVNHFINQKQVLLRQDTLWLVLPEDKHSFKKGKCKKAGFINLAFSKEMFELAKKTYGIYSEHAEDGFAYSTHLPTGLSQSVMSKISFLVRDKTNLYPISGKDTLVGILLDCFLVLQNQTYNEMSVPGWLERACNAIRKKENYREGMPRFVELAEKSQEHLTRCMKKYYNTTPAEYLNSIKLEQTIVLLETTSQTILDIMLECGFNNVSYFNQLFKRQYGVTPGRYRMLNRIVVNP